MQQREAKCHFHEKVLRLKKPSMDATVTTELKSLTSSGTKQKIIEVMLSCQEAFTYCYKIETNLSFENTF